MSFSLVHVVLRVVDIEVAGRRDQARVLDDGLELEVLSSTTTKADCLFLALQTENHTSSPGLVVLRLHHALGTVVLQVGPLGDR